MQFWPFAYALLLLTLYFVHRFRRSSLGQAALMVHMNPRLATMCGLDANRVRLKVFLVSAPISALAGWLYAFQRSYVGTDLFETYFLVLMLTSVIIAGRRVLLGPLIGTALLMSQKSFASLGAYGDKLVLGAILVAAALLQFARTLRAVASAHSTRLPRRAPLRPTRSVRSQHG